MNNYTVIQASQYFSLVGVFFLTVVSSFLLWRILMNFENGLNEVKLQRANEAKTMSEIKVRLDNIEEALIQLIAILKADPDAELVVGVKRKKTS